MHKLMRNVRTGKTALYDRELVETGRWVALEDEKPVAKPVQEDRLVVKDEVEVIITRSHDESVESEA